MSQILSALIGAKVNLLKWFCFNVVFKCDNIPTED